MRHDNIGLFWQDLPRGKGEIIREMPPIPETGWKMPTHFPNLSRASCMSVDVETWDPEVRQNGPGWARGKGHLVGVSIGVPDGGRWYFPMRHTIQPEINLQPEHVINWLKDTLSNPAQPKVGANILYDLGWLHEEGIELAGELFDVQYAEALLSEDKSVSLENLSQKYLNEGKQSNDLYEWCSSFYGGPATGTQRKNIHRAPAVLVGKYAESDADLPLRLMPILWEKLKEQNLIDLFKMECKLIRIMHKMRLRGVRVDVKKAERMNMELSQQRDAEQLALNTVAGFDVDIAKKPPLVKLFDKFGIPYPLTAKGNPSFKGDFLDTIDHPIGKHIKEIRKFEKIRGTFVQSYILDSHIDGFVYGQFHPLRSDDGGTRSGRFSSSNPNLQNIPSRDPIWGPLIRSLFIPDNPDSKWLRFDYSQIEYRVLAHFAAGHSGHTVRAAYNADPNTDYHTFTQELIFRMTGVKLGRKHTKNINFGLMYGMGISTLAQTLGVPFEEAKKLTDAYNKGAPYVKDTMNEISKEAARNGVVETILGRKARFEKWEPEDWDDRTIPLEYNKAIQKWGMNIVRAFTYKATNRKIQGSAADMMKMALVKCDESGVFRDTGYPALTVHDELDFTMAPGTEKAFEHVAHIMETCLPLKIPVKASVEIGKDWGNCKEIDLPFKGV